MNKKIWSAFALVTIASLLLAACATPTPETVVVTQIVELEGEQVTIEVPIEVTREVIVEVAPDATPVPTGGFLVESSFADANILNPILSSDSPSADVHEKLFLGLVKQDAFTGEIVGEIADSWEVSEDGLTYTFHLRDDITWSDGTPVTAADVKFTYEAIADEAVETPRKDNVALIDSIDAPDDQTLNINFSSVNCTALNDLTLGVLPAHAYSDFADVMESDFNTAPTITNGPFSFEEWVPDDHVTLVSNPGYYLGAPKVDGWSYRIFADQSSELAATLAGEVDIVESLGAQFVSVIEGEIASGAPLDVFKAFDDGYTYVGFNLANPENPQNGWEDVNENGEYDEGEPPLEQDPHPVFGDLAARQAVRHSIDVVNIVNKVVFGQAVPAVANVVPAIEWAFNANLAPPEFDLELAASILEEGGWIAGADGVRAKDGQRLEFTLMTNAGNEVRENIATIMKDTLESVGFSVDLEIIEFGTVVENLLGQTYDAVIIGWTGLGTDPDDTSLFHYQNDTVGGGFNFVSYQNTTVADNLVTGRTLPGCATADRAPLYQQNQEEIYNDAVYAFLYVPLQNTVRNTRLQDTDFGAWELYWDVEGWYITP